MSETTPTIARFVAWRYAYRFLDAEHVDIDIHITFEKADATPIVVGASLFAAGDTTPAGVVDAGAGVYDVALPIRNFRYVPWTPYGIPNATQKRYLLNLKLTTVPESEWDEPEVLAFQGATVGFSNADIDSLNATRWEPDSDDESAIRARLMQLRDGGVRLLAVPAHQPDTLYNLCDELGLLVAQELAIGDNRVSEIRRIRSHPSLALWVGSDTEGTLAAEDPMHPLAAELPYPAPTI